MLVAVEGCLGAGKTTVARGLATLRGSAVILEDFESNPFLRAFYADPKAYATEAEFAFLLLHFHQLKLTNPATEVIADFHLGKDLIYAGLNLTDEDAALLFRGMYEFCQKRAPKPDLIVYLSAPTNLLIERIRIRDRDFERNMQTDYYAAVNAAYELFFENLPGRKIRVPMEEWDFVQEPELYRRLSILVDNELASLRKTLP